MKNYYEKLSTCLVKSNVIKKEDKNLYEYAIVIIVHAILNIILTVLLGVIFNMLKETIYFFIAFIFLRKFTGGIHAKRYIFCLVYSTILMAFSLFIIKYFEQMSNHFVFLRIIIISSIMIIILSPLDNINKKLCNNEKKVYKCICFFITTIISFLSIVSFKKKLFYIGYSIGMSIILDLLLLLCGYCSKFLHYIIRRSI